MTTHGQASREAHDSEQQPARAGGDILVVGGYGVVGRLVAASLAPRFPDRVVIAGRDARRAQEFAESLAYGVRARRFDVNEPAQHADALRGVGTVMVCVAQREPRLLRAAIEEGLRYTDIAPRLPFWTGVEELHQRALQTGACVLLGAGLSPGISNMMARKLSDLAGPIESIETSILLSIGDEYGADSLVHLLESLKQPFKLFRDGRYQSALAFSDGARVAFPGLGPRTGYVFPWSDVVYYPKTLGARTAVGRLAIEPRWANDLLRALVRAGAPSWLEHQGTLAGPRRAVDWLKRILSGGDHFALQVRVEGAGKVAAMSIAGRKQAAIAAASAAELCRMLATNEVCSPGVWLPEQIVSPEPFFAALELHGWRVELHR